MSDTTAPMDTLAIWTLTLDVQDNIVTTVHTDESEVFGTLRDLFGEDRDDEGGIGAVFYIERHVVAYPRIENADQESSL